MPQVPEIDVAGYFPSASALPDYEGMLLRPWNRLAVSCFGNAILAHQPFSCGRIHERQIDLATVFSAEVLERSVGDERIQEFELPFGNQSLSILYGNANELGRSFPGIGILLDNGGSGSVVVSVISTRVALLEPAR